MDSSDVLRKTQAKAIFAYYKQTAFSQEATCNYSTCSSITGCTTKYPSYEEKQQVSYGQLLCNSCSGVGCKCGSSGGSS